MKFQLPRKHLEEGFSLIEVLVTMIILLVGLLGLIGLQGKALNAQMEAYQRSQALVLLQDMVGRLEANRTNATLYKTTGVGSGYNSSTLIANCSAKPSRAEIDLCEWHNLLLGASELDNSSGNPIVSMIGGRGCITSGAGANDYVVTVAWQGLSSTVASGSDCGKDQYGSDDKLRRTVSAPITVGVTH